MESKTKHRILGIVVVAGLAVLAYPFVQGSDTLSKEQVSVKAPPFPDQAIQVTSNDESAVVESQSMMTASASDVSEPLTAPQDPALNPNREGIINIAEPGDAPPADDAKTPAPEVPPEVIIAPEASTVTPDASKQVAPEAEAPTPTVEKQPMSGTDATTPATHQSSMNGASSESAPTAETITSKSKKKLSSHTSKAKPSAPILMSKFTTTAAINANKRLPVSNNGLLQLKKAAYVVQLGSFKEKANALRLVNKLRAQGYRAFIQHNVMASGQNTRVFVGPEHHQASARVLAAELENKMKVHGIVISYKPFTL